MAAIDLKFEPRNTSLTRDDVNQLNKLLAKIASSITTSTAQTPAAPTGSPAGAVNAQPGTPIASTASAGSVASVNTSQAPAASTKSGSINQEVGAVVIAAQVANMPAGAAAGDSEYLTADAEGASLPNSRQLAAGAGINLVDGGAGSTLSIVNTSPIVWAEQRVTTGALVASTTTSVLLTWTTPFADANYSPVASVVDSSGFLSVVNIVSYDMNGVTVAIKNSDASNPHTGTLCLIAIHD